MKAVSPLRQLTIEVQRRAARVHDVLPVSVRFMLCSSIGTVA